MQERTSSQAADVRRALARARQKKHEDMLGKLAADARSTLLQVPAVRARVYVFGSWATGAFDSYSDIDLVAITPDADAACEAERRLLAVADDVLAFSEACWQEKVASGDPFWARVAAQRQPLMDTWTEAAS